MKIKHTEITISVRTIANNGNTINGADLVYEFDKETALMALGRIINAAGMSVIYEVYQQAESLPENAVLQPKEINGHSHPRLPE